MGENKIYPFGDEAVGATILPDSVYEGATGRRAGHSRGEAQRALFNKTLKQTSALAAGLAEFIADRQPGDVTDALTPQQIAAMLLAAIVSECGGNSAWDTLAFIKDYNYDDNTGILTFIYRDNTTSSINIAFAELFKDLDYDPVTAELIIIKQDDSEIRVSVADLIDVYHGSNGQHIQIGIGPGNIINAILKSGTVTVAELASSLSSRLNKIEGNEAAIMQLAGLLASKANLTNTITIDGVTKALGDNPIFSGAGGSGDGIPLLSMIWSTTSKPRLGYLNISQDQGLLLRSAFPEAWADISTLPSTELLSDADWLTEKAANGGVCGKYSSGDGSTTFRAPLISKRFIRATASDLPVGTAQGDAIRNITGKAGSPASWQSAATNDPNHTDGAFYPLDGLGGYPASGGKLAGYSLLVGFDASRVVPTADETRPVFIAYTPMLKMFGAVADAGTVQLAQLIAAMVGKADNDLQNADGNLDFVVDSWTASDGSAWYRKYRSGWVEQGGFTVGTQPYTVTITLPMVMATNEYGLQVTFNGLAAAGTQYLKGISGKTITSFSVIGAGSAVALTNGFDWRASGQAA